LCAALLDSEGELGGGKRGGGGTPVTRCEIVIRRPSRASAAIGVSILQSNSFVCVLAGALSRSSCEAVGKVPVNSAAPYESMNGAIICLERERKTRLVARARCG